MQPFPPALHDLIVNKPLQALGPGKPHEEKRAALEALSVSTAFAPHAVRDEAMARACLAGLWLAYDFLDESHAISQEIDTAEGSYWHALMHRREPDYGNSKYWFRRVGTHPIFEELAKRTDIAPLEKSAWDPFAFVDLCEQAARRPEPLREACRRVQNFEWELLFDYCYRGAIE